MYFNFYFKRFLVVLITLISQHAFSQAINIPINANVGSQTYSSSVTLPDGTTNFIRKSETEVRRIVNRIRAVKKQVQESDLYSLLVEGKEVNLPVAILGNTDDKDYALYLDSIVITPTKTYAVVYMAIAYENDTLYFGANDIAFSKDGGFVGEPKISLLKSVKVKFGNNVNQHFLADDIHQTYVSFNCKGFKELHVDGKMVFNNSVAIPEDANGNPNPKDSVQLDYSINVRSLKDYLVEFQSINRFRLSKLKDCSFEARGLVFDHSDTKNSEYTKFPDVYKYHYTVDDNGNVVTSTLADKDVSVTWHGFSLKEAEITFPKPFKRENNERTKVVFNEFIIDRQGFSGQVGAKNLLPWNKAESKNGFKISLDTVYVAFVQNNLIGGGFGGDMNIPINKKDTKLAYLGGIMEVDGDMQYSAEVSLTSEMDFDCFKVAQVNLQPGSIINLQVINDDFSASANLTGSITVVSEVKKDNSDKANVRIDFVELQLSTTKPYFDVKEIGLNKDLSAKIGNFEITVSNFKFKKRNKDEGVGLGMDIGASMSGGSSGFGGTAGLIIWAKRNTEKRWVFDEVEFTKLCIDVDNKSYAFHGCIEKFEGVPIYGSGYAGEMTLSLEKPKIEILAKGIFGKVADPQNITEEYNYWFVDAGAILPIGIPIPPCFSINGFYGGVSHHMTMNKQKVADYKNANPTMLSSSSTEMENLGKSLSGSTYVPDKEAYIGIRFGVNFTTESSEEVLNGQLVFFAGLTEGKGLDYLGIEGGAQLLSLPLGDATTAANNATSDDAKESSKDTYKDAMIRLEWSTVYHVREEIFEGSFTSFINVKNVIVGSRNESTGEAGNIEIYANGKTGQWYTYIGTPQQMNGLKLNLAIMSINIQSYFVMGNLLPTPPIADYPPQVKFSGAHLADSPLLRMASGFAFGARMSISGEGSARLGAGCYVEVGAKLNVGAGFDMLFIKVNKDLLPPQYCGINKDDIGMKGWYAAGQLFGYASINVYGKVGCEIDLGFTSVHKDFSVNLLSLNASLALQGQGPHPTSFSGEFNLSLQLPIMGSVSMNFHGTLGDKCDDEINNNNLLLISSITPADAQQEVDVYSKVTVTFKAAIGSSIQITDQGGNPIDITLKFDPNSDLKLYKKDANGTLWPIAGKVEMSKDNTSASYIPNEVLPANTLFEIAAYLGYDNTPRVESKITHFKTKDEDYLIPNANVKYSYPLPNMDNFYTKESNRGYIKLFIKPNKALSSMTGYVYRVQISKGGTEVFATSKVIISETNTRVSFPLPVNDLDPSQQYTFRLVKMAAEDTLSKGTKLESGQQSGYASETTLKPKFTLLEYNFKTSKYSTFSEKMADYLKSIITFSSGIVTQELTASSSTPEAFGFLESSGYVTGGNNTTGPLIKAEVKFSSTKQAAINSFYATYTPAPDNNGEITNAFNCFKFTSVMNTVAAVYKSPAVLAKDIRDAKSKGTSINNGDDMDFKNGEVCNYEVGYYLPGESVPNTKSVISFIFPQDYTVK